MYQRGHGRGYGRRPYPIVFLCLIYRLCQLEALIPSVIWLCRLPWPVRQSGRGGGLAVVMGAVHNQQYLQSL